MQPAAPDDTAVRTALWRALHLEVDPPPHTALRRQHVPDEGAITATLHQVVTLAPSTTLVMSFMLPIELMDPAVRPGVERAAEGARANGTPFISFFTPHEMLALARDAGLKDVRHVSAAMLAQRYFAGRTDGLRPPNNSEELLVAGS